MKTPFARLLPAALLLLSACLSASPATDEARVRDLMARMTLEEKVGQLMQYSNPQKLTGPGSKADISGEIRAGRVGSMFNVIGAAASRELQEMAVKGSRLGIPLIFGLDVIHGYRTIFPIPLGQAASWDMEAIRAAERIAAVEATAAGQNWTFAPMVDIARDPRWGRIAESSGEDTYLGSAIAVARVKGFQGDDLRRADTLLACAKHFAAYGAAQAGREYNSTEVPEIVLRETYLPPFKAALDAGVGSFMAAFNDLNGMPASGNPWLLDQVLRREWGFRGFVVSDWGSVVQLVEHGFAADGREAALRGFGAGVDMDMENHLYAKQLPALVEQGLVPRERLEAAVAAILRAKVSLGLLDNPYRNCDTTLEASAMLRPAHLEAARSLARESCVLLKNDGTLPLKANARVALVGPLADSAGDLLGCWRAQGEESEVRGLRPALKERFPKLLSNAKGADVIVAVLGEAAELSGEGHSRSDIGLPAGQLNQLRELKASGKPVVVVLLSGRPLVIGELLGLADAVLLAWHPGTMGGPAIAELLCGDVSPSGKLPATFPRAVGQIPLYYGYKMTGRPQADPDVREMYKTNYIDVANSPQLPFGFGLSYTRFSYSKAELSSPTLPMKGRLGISVTLTNTGGREGSEVVQLYVRDLVGSVTRPVRELKGFQRVALKPGESRLLRFELSPADLAFVHADMSVAPEPGRFQVFVGGDSEAPLAGELTLLAE